jgi:transcriptional regulator with XRE-family HTH domain
MDKNYNGPNGEEMNRSRARILSLFGRNLQRERKQKALTQEALASSAGMSDKYIGELERGEKNPSLHIVVCLARGLKVDPCRLLGLSHPPSGPDIVLEDKRLLVSFMEKQNETVLRAVAQLIRILHEGLNEKAYSQSNRKDLT